MNVGKFYISMKCVEKILKRFNLHKMNGIKSIQRHGVSDEFKNLSIKPDYPKAYLSGLDNYDYDYLLSDQSYLQFEFSSSKSVYHIRYSFFQNPFVHKSYEEFFRQELGLEEQSNEYGQLFASEYSQYLSEQPLTSSFLTMRYDMDVSSHKPLIHSTSHIHIGHRNNIRIPVNKIITPSKFTIFVLKNVYYKEWCKIFENDNQYIEGLLGEARSELSLLPKEQWNEHEQLELFLT